MLINCIRKHAHVTTPIFYVNSRPHLGHAYTMVLASAISKVIKKRNPNDLHFFSTGTD